MKRTASRRKRGLRIFRIALLVAAVFLIFHFLTEPAGSVDKMDEDTRVRKK